MARRRLIAPGIWQSGHFKRFNFRQRLLWIGVITRADDTGKLKGEPAVLKAEIFPFDAIGVGVIDEDLAKLEQEGLIRRYEVAGDRYILIVKWKRYQKPSHPTPSTIPDPLLDNSGGFRESRRRYFRIQPEQSSPEQGGTGQVTEGESGKGEASAAKRGRR